jgi:hypothetical protein
MRCDWKALARATPAAGTLHAFFGQPRQGAAAGGGQQQGPPAGQSGSKQQQQPAARKAAAAPGAKPAPGTLHAFFGRQAKQPARAAAAGPGAQQAGAEAAVPGRAGSGGSSSGDDSDGGGGGGAHGAPARKRPASWEAPAGEAQEAKRLAAGAEQQPHRG